MMNDEPLAVSARQETNILFAGTITIAKLEPQLSTYTNISIGFEKTIIMLRLNVF